MKNYLKLSVITLLTTLGFSQSNIGGSPYTLNNYIEFTYKKTLTGQFLKGRDLETKKIAHTSNGHTFQFSWRTERLALQNWILGGET